jgi:hypothetical protein
VPAIKEYEFGWNRGNPNHYISRYEQNKDHRFRTRVRIIPSISRVYYIEVLEANMPASETIIMYALAPWAG